MAHFAEIDENNTVIRVLVTDNNDPIGDEGYQWLIDTFGGNWIKTSYNHRIRKQFAGIGYKYDADADVFIAPQPYPSWSLDNNFDWQPPIAKPNQGLFEWNEEIGNWVEATAL